MLVSEGLYTARVLVDPDIPGSGTMPIFDNLGDGHQLLRNYIIRQLTMPEITEDNYCVGRGVNR